MAGSNLIGFIACGFILPMFRISKLVRGRSYHSGNRLCMTKKLQGQSRSSVPVIVTYFQGVKRVSDPEGKKIKNVRG